MKKYIFIALMLAVISVGCIESQTFNAKNKKTAEQSFERMEKNLSAEDVESLKEALLYFGLNRDGENSFLKMMSMDAAEGEKLMYDNMSVLNGLTAQEILSKYKNSGNLKDKKSTTAKKDHSLDYASNIEVVEFLTKRIGTYLDGKVPAVRVSLKNKGDKTINYLKVTVYFKDNNDVIIYEHDFALVNVNAISIYGGNKPLRPNYIYEMPTDKYLTVDNNPISQWKEGNAELKIVEIMLADE